jgi:hypothetical protein
VTAITKSNEHKLSLDYDKHNKKGGCSLATPYALIRSLILDSQISITPLGSCSPLHSKVFSQLNKWTREVSWTSRRSINTPTNLASHLKQNNHSASWPDAPIRVTGRVRSVQHGFKQPVSRWSDRTQRGVRSVPTWRVRSQKSSLDPFCTWLNASNSESSHVLEQRLVLRELYCSISYRYWHLRVWSSFFHCSALQQLTWSIRSHKDQRSVTIDPLHSLPKHNTLWTKFTPINLWAVSELSSTKFDMCATHLTH